jgi:hypothetical protein
MSNAFSRTTLGGCTAVAILLAGAPVWAQTTPAPSLSSPPAGAPGATTGTPPGTDGGGANASAGASSDPFDWQSPVPDLFKTRTPGSPAFVLLGLSPTEIQRPTTPNDVAVALSSFVDANSNLTIPQNLSLEIAPYWLFSHPYLTADKYESGGAAALYRMFTISVATRTTTETVIMGGTAVSQSVGDLALGARTRVLDGTTATQACKAKVQAAAQAVSVARQLPDDVMASLAKQYSFGTPEYIAALKAAKDKAMGTQADELAKVGSDCAQELSARTGFTLDVAGGGAWRFVNDTVSTDNAHLLEAGGWIAGGYTWANASLLGLGRAARRTLDTGERQSVGDAGARGIYAASRYGASLEGIYRHRFSGAGVTNTYRLDATVEYRVTGSSWLSITFGKEFAGSEAGSIFSLGNFSWGFGDRKVSGPGS